MTNAEWSEFDLTAGWWTIPAAKAKNNLPHRVPLSQLAFEALHEIKQWSGKSNWLFPSPRDGQPITTRSLSQALRKNVIQPFSNPPRKKKRKALFGAETFTPHDLKRSAASHMASMGITRLTISKILNHVETGVTAVYARHSYDNEKKQALSVWARKLESILNGKKGKLISLPSNRP